MSKEKNSTNSAQNDGSLRKPSKEMLAISIIHEITKSLLSEHDLQKLLDTIADKALKVLGADLVTLYEYNKEEDDVKIPPIIKGKPKAIDVLQEKGKAVPHKKSITFKMIERKKPLYAENAKEDWVKEGFISKWSIRSKKSFINREEIVSSAGIPFCVEDEVVGVLFVNYRKLHRFTSIKKEGIKIFANYAALAIRNARIFSKSQRYVKQLSVLNEIGKKISLASTSNIDEILYLVYAQTKRIMDATNFYIALYDDQNDTVHFKLAMEDDQRKEVGSGDWKSRQGGSGLTEYVIREKKPRLLSRDAEKWIRSQKKVKGIGKPTKSWLGAPMIVNERVLGVIAVQNHEEENIFDEDHLNVLVTIASQTAIAISKANIFQESEDRYQELSALYDTSKEIAEKSLDIKKVLQAITKRAAELSKADGGAILLCDHYRKELQVVVTHNLNQLIGLKVAFGTGMSGRVALSGKPMIQNEYFKWKGMLPIFKEKHYKNLFRAIVQVPLEWGGKVIGVLSMSSSEKNHKFTEFDRRILERFAVPAAIAITNARIHSYLQTLVDNTPDAIIAVDTSGTVTEFNKASEDILGYRMEVVVGGPVEHLYWGGLNEARRINTLMKTAKNGKKNNVYTYVKSKGGEKIPIRFAGSLLYNEYRERIGSVGHMEDLREIRLLEDRYRALYEVGKVAVEILGSDMKKICQEFIDVLTKRVLHFKASYICLVDEDGELEIMAVDGDAEKYNIKSLFWRGQRFFSQFMKNKEPIYIKNVQMDKRFKHLKWAKINKIYSSLTIPLFVRDNIIGEITVFKGEECEFLEREKEFLDRFASQAALVIDKAKDVKRIKEIADTLQDIIYDIVELSGDYIFGDIWDKITTIIDIRVPSTNFCLYKCDAENDKLAILMESNSEDLRSRLKAKCYRGKSPFKSKTVTNSAYLLNEARGYGQPGRVEGFLVFEKVPKKEGSTAQFTRVERLVLSMVASAVGIALFRWRVNLQQDPTVMIEGNNTSKVDEK